MAGPGPLFYLTDEQRMVQELARSVAPHHAGRRDEDSHPIVPL